MDININLSGLDALAASIESLAEALKAGVTANEVIAKASSRKPKPPAPVAAAPEVGNAPASGPTDTATPATPASTAPVVETPSAAPEPSKPASPSEPVAAHEAEAATFNIAAQDGKPTIAQVRAAIAKLAQTDKARALEILSKRGAASVSALKEEDYAAAFAEASK